MSQLLGSPTVLIVTGPPASGKSQLARAILARYSFVAIAKDVIKESLFDSLGATNAAESSRLSDASFALMFRMAAATLRGGASVLLEGNFRRGQHETPLRRGIGDAPIVQVLCEVDETERRQRLAARANDVTRHPLHRLGEARPLTAADVGFLNLPGVRVSHRGADTDATLALIERVLDANAR
jgi:predicted kinase